MVDKEKSTGVMWWTILALLAIVTVVNILIR